MTRDGTTVLLTTQYLDEADRFAARVAVIDQGRVVADGTPASLKSRVGRATLAIQLDATFIEAKLRDITAPFGHGAPIVRGEEFLLPLRDLAGTADIMAALAAAGVSLNAVSVVTPSMDDVFFELTGHTTAPAQESAA